MNGGGGVRGRPCMVGLTGGLASGKSSAARRLAELGAAVLDADAVVHELYEPGEPGAAAVRELFGEDVLDVRGGVDRGALAARIREDADALPRLNAAIHPLVREQVSRWIDGLSRRTEPPRVAVVEATLMVESGSYREYDLLVVVWCRPEQQLERAMGRGVPADRARALLAGQMPLEEKRRLAHIVIDNSGPLENLAPEVDGAWRRILEICASR